MGRLIRAISVFPFPISGDAEHLRLGISAHRKLQTAAVAGPGARPGLGRLQLLRRRRNLRVMIDAVHRADLCADVAIDAAFGVNPVLAVGLVEIVDGVGRAGTPAPPAVDAAVLVDYVGHGFRRLRTATIAGRFETCPYPGVPPFWLLPPAVAPTKLAAISRTIDSIFSNSSWAVRARSFRHGCS